MTSRRLIDRLLSPAGFALVLLGFLLPFATVSCEAGGPTIEATFTGIDYVVGGEPDVRAGQMSEAEAREGQYIIAGLYENLLDVEPFALLAALAAMVAMATGLVRARLLRHSAGAGLAAVVAALLVAAQLRVFDRVDTAQRTVVAGVDPAELGGPWTVTTRAGFWLAVGTAVALLAGHAVALVRAWRDPSPPPAPAPPEPDRPVVEVTAIPDEWWSRDPS
jgi:hypothetical protein